MQRFESENVLVTGAASGIGMATARRLAQEGANLFLVDVQEQALQVFCEELKANGVKASFRTCDVSDEQDVGDCLAACVAVMGQLDVLCNIAGILRFDNFHELSLDDWNRVISVNLTGVF